jgi:hypothetical protein
MVRFEEITEKTLRANYVKEDMEGYKVVGNATYNKEKKLTNAYGDIRDAEDKHIANFNAYGEGEAARISLTDCLAGYMSEAVGVAESTLKDLAGAYPQE